MTAEHLFPHTTPPYIKPHDNGIYLSIHLQPGAKNDSIEGVYGEAIKIKIKAQPVDGKANDYLIRFLSKMLHFPQSAITLTKGHASRSKTVYIDYSHSEHDLASICALFSNLV